MSVADQQVPVRDGQGALRRQVPLARATASGREGAGLGQRPVGRSAVGDDLVRVGVVRLHVDGARRFVLHCHFLLRPLGCRSAVAPERPTLQLSGPRLDAATCLTVH